ncbi:hypothetical protein HanIR_Chr15g0730681 [Helianthus annuus]|nr:hypothetical protein HanIR_Chr15g0730681 [Helianthus annuus]
MGCQLCWVGVWRVESLNPYTTHMFICTNILTLTQTLKNRVTRTQAV